MIKVVFKAVDKEPVLLEIESTLEGWYRLLDVRMIQALPIGRNLSVICDEEGLTSGAGYNCTLGEELHLVGNIAVCGGTDDEGETLSLTDDEAAHALSLLSIENSYDLFAAFGL